MKLYNTLSRKIEALKPLEANKIKMYTCGLTVYSQPQIGNWVAYIYSDVLTRTLLQNGFDVFRVQNITDVGHLVSDNDSGEDKMEKGARAEGLTAWNVAEKYIRIAQIEAYEWLELLVPNKIVRATDLIEQQIDFVKVLEEKGYTYIIPDEGVYFDTSKLKDYGKLARLDIEGLQAGTRVDVNGKKSPTDFALWKFSPKDIKRDMQWGSPWGAGFPGWHLECSVIARENLGDQIDIHTGGIDHIPVHHTNEIAQTETVTGKQFSKYWFHNNHIKVNGAKLAKSEGNSYTLSEIMEKGIDLNAFKIMVLSSHYRTEGNFSWEILEASQHRFNHWRAVADLQWQAYNDSKETNIDIAPFLAQLNSAMSDDLDTPLALMIIDKTLDLFENRALSSGDVTALVSFLELIKSLLGISLHSENIGKEIHSMISEREIARQNNDWNTADTLRLQLQSKGIAISDTGFGTVWWRI